MKNYAWDIETIPAPGDILDRFMPEEVATLQPFVEPVMPDFLDKVPAYGNNASLPDGRRLWEGLNEKQKEWFAKKQADWVKDTDEARASHTFKQAEARQKFIDNAALNAQTAEIKLMGIATKVDEEATVLVANATNKEKKRILEGAYALKAKFLFLTEAHCLQHFSDFVKRNIKEHNVRFAMTTDEAATGADAMVDEGGRLVTCYGALFDLPMSFRRSWALGVVPPLFLKKGRYFDDRLHVDLAELYQLGNRDHRFGGLDGLCKLLGVATKSGHGGQFHQRWANDPADAVGYHIQDLICTIGCAEKMGVIR